ANRRGFASIDANSRGFASTDANSRGFASIDAPPSAKTRELIGASGVRAGTDEGELQNLCEGLGSQRG
ncbi:hypothetical protein T484DRAFT_1901367, partial [Baffinella frigidus]